MRQSGWFPWNGSKTWLLEDLEPVLRLWSGKGRYIDPFVGGGSVSRIVRRLFPHAPHVVADANQWLVSAYAQARSEDDYRVPRNIGDVAYWRGLTDADFPELAVAERATRFAVCLRSAWGNRWETYPNGQFRSTMNKLWRSASFLGPKVETMFQEHWFRQGDKACHGDWKQTVADAKPGDLVYIDPPYPEALGYGNQWWSFDDALDIVDWVAAHPKVGVVVSNMSTLRRLYERIGLHCQIVTGPAPMKTRRQRLELLAHNFSK